jgi:hypothetical protein
MLDVGITGISDQQLLAVIETGKGNARDITDALIDVVLEALDLRSAQVQNAQDSTVV